MVNVAAATSFGTCAANLIRNHGGHCHFAASFRQRPLCRMVDNSHGAQQSRLRLSMLNHVALLESISCV